MDRKDLKNYRYTQEWIKGRMEYIEEQKAQVNKLTATLSDMPMGSKAVPHSMAEKLVKLMDCFNEILDKILIEQEKQQNILECLESIEQPYGLILFKIYIEGKTLVKVADEMKYSYEWMKHMHGVALNKFDMVA
jgi:hypothetical protein